MRRSVSASRGGGNVMSSSVHGGSRDTSNNTNNSNSKLVKKSRPTQTSLTKDPCHDTPADSDNPGLVNFQVSFTAAIMTFEQELVQQPASLNILFSLN